MFPCHAIPAASTFMFSSYTQLEALNTPRCRRINGSFRRQSHASDSLIAAKPRFGLREFSFRTPLSWQFPCWRCLTFHGLQSPHVSTVSLKTALRNRREGLLDCNLSLSQWYGLPTRLCSRLWVMAPSRLLRLIGYIMSLWTVSAHP